MFDPSFAETLASAAGIAAVSTMIVNQVRATWPEITGSGAVLLTWLLCPAIAAGSWALGLMPETVDWRTALAVGVNAVFLASGSYAQIKTAIADRTIAKQTTPRRVRRPAERSEG